MTNSRSIISFLLLPALIWGLLLPKSGYSQLSFNDILVLSEIKNKEIANRFLLENKFEYVGVIEKDRDGYTVHKWSNENGITWVEIKYKNKIDQETELVTEINITNFYTSSESLNNSLQLQMFTRGYHTSGKPIIEDATGFNSYLYAGEGYLALKMILYGSSNVYRETKTYRYLIF